MIRTIIITPDRELSGELHRAVVQFGNINVVRTIDHFPSIVELTRFVRAHAPQLVLLGVDSVHNIAVIAAHLETIAPGVQIVAAGRQVDAEGLMRLMRAGVREFLPSPVELSAMRACIQRTAENLERRPVSLKSTDLVYSFLPAKAGVGASTLAVHASAAMAASTTEGKTLLTDFDLNSGIIRFLLKVDGSYSVVDAVDRVGQLDDSVWSQLVSHAGPLDVLPSGIARPDVRLEMMQIQRLIEFARCNYKAVSFDLSGNLEKYSLELMHESRRVFLVTTTEICSLYLAREKYQYLRQMDLGDKVSILVNRYNKRSSMSITEVESLIGAPVMMAFPNDYMRISKAATEGKAIDFGSELGKQCMGLADWMLERKAPAPEQKRKFVEYFSLAPTKYSLESRRLSV